ncbi:MAG: hypothetical protein II388_01180, partial [Clostridia bacterium]|nr:hypothetical protein [Clostridia bacterium]
MPDFTNTSKNANDRVKFEPNDTTKLMFKNDYFEMYNDTRAGRTFKVIDGMIVPTHQKDVNMWKARERNKNNFKVEIERDAAGKVFDYKISRAAQPGDAPAAPPSLRSNGVAPPAPPTPPTPPAPGSNRMTPPAPPAPGANRVSPPPARPSRPTPPAPAAKPQRSSQPVETIIEDSEKATRIAFAPSDTYKEMFSNQYFKIYNDTRAGRTFKVIEGEMVPIEQREVNFWKNHQRRPNEFIVEIVKDRSGKIYDYKISKNQNEDTAAADKSEPAAAQDKPTTPSFNRPTPPAPAANRPTPPTPAANRPTPPAPGANRAPAAALSKAPRSTGGKASAPKVKETIGTAPTNMVPFTKDDTTELILQNQYASFYIDKRAGRTFKIIDEKKIPIEQREMNFWKNREKNPQGFALEVFKDSTGKMYDCKISKVNEDGSLTPAPEVQKAAPYVAPATDTSATTAATTAKKDAPKAGAGSKEDVKTSTLKEPKKARIKFVENEYTKLVIENQYCKIYNDTRAGKTYKIVNGMIVPIELRELNFWKNYKNKPQNFSVEVIKDETGADYDYVITRKSNAPTAAVETTSTKTNMPPVAPNSAGDAPKRKRPNSSRTAKCTICGKEYKESDLYLFDNR